RRGAAVADEVARADWFGDRVGHQANWYAIIPGMAELPPGDVSGDAQRHPARDRLADRAVRLGVGNQSPHLVLGGGRLDPRVQVGLEQVMPRPVAPGEPRGDGGLDL